MDYEGVEDRIQQAWAQLKLRMATATSWADSRWVEIGVGEWNFWVMLTPRS